VQAVVLAGGEGTRLRPLTLTMPKPVVPLAGRPFLSFMLDWLEGHGVEEVLLCCGFRAERVAQVLGTRHGSLALRYVNEDEPLGTAGPLRLAHDQGLLAERFFVLNGDALCDFDLTALLGFHADRGALATLALYPVEQTSSYGVVPTGGDGQVEAFLEKQDGPVPTNRINAGSYVVERSVVDGIARGRAVSFEREIFPALVGNGLYGLESRGYWIDIGTPERYFQATRDLLAGTVASTLPPRDRTGSLVLEGARVEGAEIGPLSVVGADCVVAPGATVERSVLHDGVRVGEESHVVDSVLAEGVDVGSGVRIGPNALVGAGARVEAGAAVEAGGRIPPEAQIVAGAQVS